MTIFFGLAWRESNKYLKEIFLSCFLKLEVIMFLSIKLPDPRADVKEEPTNEL
jgi:hypothetical protein